MKASMLIIRIVTIVLLAIIAILGVLFLLRYDGPGVTNKTNDSTKSSQTTSDSDKKVSAPLTLYYVAIDDNGKSGEQIGCGDSLVPVVTEPVSVNNRLYEAMKRMVTDTSQTIGDTELYNVLYQADLTLETAKVENDTAKVSLSGQLDLRGVCDNPRVEAQLEQTAKAAAGTDKVEIRLNDQPLEDALSLR